MCHVLIIEDEPMTALHLEAILVDAGATSIDIAASAHQAVELALARRPEIITSDVRLASGRGPEAVAEIHAQLGPVPVIFITASPEECHPCTATSIVLTKPVVASTLAATFRSTLHAL